MTRRSERPSNGKAFDVLLTAGELRGEGTRWRRAVELHERAAALGRSVEMRAAVLEALGDDHDAVLHGDAALASYRRAISVLRDEPAGDEDAWSGLHEGGSDDPGEERSLQHVPGAGADR